jgi:hypothetical protein
VNEFTDLMRLSLENLTVESFDTTTTSDDEVAPTDAVTCAPTHRFQICPGCM